MKYIVFVAFLAYAWADPKEYSKFVEESNTKFNQLLIDIENEILKLDEGTTTESLKVHRATFVSYARRFLNSIPQMPNSPSLQKFKEEVNEQIWNAIDKMSNEGRLTVPLLQEHCFELARELFYSPHKIIGKMNDLEGEDLASLQIYSTDAINSAIKMLSKLHTELRDFVNGASSSTGKAFISD